MSIVDTFVAAITDGSLLVAAPVAVTAGVISFLSPCCLPLVPGYLSFVTGLSGADLADAEATPAPQPVPATVGGAAQPVSEAATPGPATSPAAPRLVAPRGRVLLGSVLFVLGFSAVFVSEGALFGGLGTVLLVHQRAVEVVLGAITVLLGLSFAGVVPLFNREFRIHRLPKAGLAGAPLLGVVFGVGWTPCLGPTLGAIQTLAYTQGGAARGAVLTFFYCLGLGLPFIAAGLLLRRSLTIFAVLRRRAQLITRLGGALLITLGLLLMTGYWDHLTIALRTWVSGYATSV